ncbi:MAG: DNA repair protein RadA [Dehalococcoidales bacterium]|nr:DNA repair protein RadA [Dehalococcoidales bacterium]
MDKTRLVYECPKCGAQSPKWWGFCRECGAREPLVEKTVTRAVVSSKRSPSRALVPEELSQVSVQSFDRFALPIAEFNRVLGGGIVPGSLVLIGGEPGIGKSTLLLQVSAEVAKQQGNVVYISGEETANQIKLRAHRLGIDGAHLYLLSETDIDAILNNVEALAPALLVIDSIQTTHVAEEEGIPGSVTQVRQSAMKLMAWAKSSGVPVFISGHVTKEGAIAGPRLLEHIVDVVLYLEGEQFSAYRLLRCVKNRYGSTNEVGVFEMKEKGMLEVENPSKVFLSQRQDNTIGSVVVPVIEGSRPLLVEIQALTNATAFGMPRRTANGVDFNRLLIIIAVLSRRLGLKLGAQDIMVNVTGGLKIDEPAADLGIALAIASSFRDTPVDAGLIAVGEVGLSGELRAVPQVDRRVAEAARMGFTRCLAPKAGSKSSPVPKGIEIITFSSLKDAVERGLGKSTLVIG